uniref:Uncharacterized protein n=1 Tax=Porphyridium sordidum TaxID=28024 RepID=A0A1C9CDU3_PORSO|nr:hypothetical protein Psor_052 [Porphyridium sordidum]AOM66527.1 hypothetical protein Psor_052 [Porphyridium sordidum]
MIRSTDSFYYNNLPTIIDNSKLRLISINSLSDTWIINSNEGIQNSLFYNGLKLNQISNIFIINHNIKNINGLVGLLATLNLAGRRKPFFIYAHESIKTYIFAIMKYSQTNFAFPIVFIDLKQKLIYQNKLFSLLFIPNKTYRKYTIICLNQQKTGSFFVKYAIRYGLRPSSIYKMLKNGKNFINWEGTIYKGKKFCDLPKEGYKFVINPDFFNRRLDMEINNYIIKKDKLNTSFYKDLYKEFIFQEYKY